MNNKHFTAILTVAIVAGAAVAQGSNKQALLMAMQANGKQMSAYQWKQKITIFRRGNPSPPMIEELRFDATGQIQRIVLAKPEERRMGPLRARKAAAIKEDIQDVMQLARRYANPHQIAEAIQKGEIWEGQGRLRVQSRAMVLPGDELSLLINGASFLATRMDVKTQYEGAPVTIAVDYEQLLNGPSMMSRMTVEIPKDGIVVRVESFDFERLARY